MRNRWQIACYKDSQGNIPVVEYMFDGTNITDLEVMISAIQHLSRVGQVLACTEMAKYIVSPIYELRKDRHRILYAEDPLRVRFVLLSAFLKETQKTPLEQIEQAKSYWQEYLKTGNCNVFKVPFDRF